MELLSSEVFIRKGHENLEKNINKNKNANLLKLITYWLYLVLFNLLLALKIINADYFENIVSMNKHVLITK
jgi:preprotein translocase subunit SecG